MKTKELMILNGSPVVLAVSERIPSSKRKKNLFYYDVRHDDDCLGTPVTIKNRVLVNHYGTIVLTKPLDFNEVYELSDEESEELLMVTG